MSLLLNPIRHLRVSIPSGCLVHLESVEPKQDTGPDFWPWYFKDKLAERVASISSLFETARLVCLQVPCGC